MAIKNRSEVKDGTVLEAKYKGKQYRVAVVGTPEGLRFGDKAGKLWTSISAVATSITKHAMNGWSFFSIVPAPAMSGQERPKAKAKRKSRAKAKTTPAETPQVEGDLEHPSADDERSVPMV